MADKLPKKLLIELLAQSVAQVNLLQQQVSDLSTPKVSGTISHTVITVALQWQMDEDDRKAFQSFAETYLADIKYVNFAEVEDA